MSELTEGRGRNGKLWIIRRFVVDSADRDSAPRPTSSDAAFGFFDVAVLRKGLQVPRHVARTIGEQFSSLGSGEGTFTQQRFKQGKTNRVRKSADDAWIGQLPRLFVANHLPPADRLLRGRRPFCRH